METITLPFPPSVNRLWRAIPSRFGCRAILSREGRLYRQSVMERIARPSSPLTGRLKVSITLYPESKRRFDLDNRLKSLLDALQHAGVIEDDSQIDRITIERGPVRKNPCAEVVIDG